MRISRPIVAAVLATAASTFALTSWVFMPSYATQVRERANAAEKVIEGLRNELSASLLKFEEEQQHALALNTSLATRTKERDMLLALNRQRQKEIEQFAADEQRHNRFKAAQLLCSKALDNQSIVAACSDVIELREFGKTEDQVGALTRRAAIRQSEKSFGLAANDYQHAVDLHPADIQLRLYLADALEANGRPGEAAKHRFTAFTLGSNGGERIVCEGAHENTKCRIEKPVSPPVVARNDPPPTPPAAPKLQKIPREPLQGGLFERMNRAIAF